MNGLFFLQILGLFLLLFLFMFLFLFLFVFVCFCDPRPSSVSLLPPRFSPRVVQLGVVLLRLHLRWLLVWPPNTAAALPWTRHPSPLLVTSFVAVRCKIYATHVGCNILSQCHAVLPARPNVRVGSAAILSVAAGLGQQRLRRVT